MSEITEEAMEVLAHLRGACGSGYAAAFSGKIADLLEALITPTPEQPEWTPAGVLAWIGESPDADVLRGALRSVGFGADEFRNVRDKVTAM